MDIKGGTDRSIGNVGGTSSKMLITRPHRGGNWISHRSPVTESGW